VPVFSNQEYDSWYNAFLPVEIDYSVHTPADGRLEKLVFDISTVCNLGCSYCFAGQGHYERDSPWGAPQLTPEMAGAIVRKVTENCSLVESVKFFGGEPLMNPAAIAQVCGSFRDALEGGRITRLPKYNVVTNGTFLNENIARILYENNIRMTISVDGPKEIHDRERKYHSGRGSFDIVVKNIRRTAEYQLNLDIVECAYNVNHASAGYSLLDVHKYLHDLVGQFCKIIVLHPLDQPSLDAIEGGPGKSRYVIGMRENARELYEYLFLEELRDQSCLRHRKMMKI
jgi:uncharacterized protein